MAQYKVIRPFHSNVHKTHFVADEVVNFDDQFVKDFKLDSDYVDDRGVKHLAKVEKIKAKPGPKPAEKPEE